MQQVCLVFFQVGTETKFSDNLQILPQFIAYLCIPFSLCWVVPVSPSPYIPEILVHIPQIKYSKPPTSVRKKVQFNNVNRIHLSNSLCPASLLSAPTYPSQLSGNTLWLRSQPGVYQLDPKQPPKATEKHCLNKPKNTQKKNTKERDNTPKNSPKHKMDVGDPWIAHYTVVSSTLSTHPLLSLHEVTTWVEAAQTTFCPLWPHSRCPFTYILPLAQQLPFCPRGSCLPGTNLLCLKNIYTIQNSLEQLHIWCLHQGPHRKVGKWPGNHHCLQ